MKEALKMFFTNTVCVVEEGGGGYTHEAHRKQVNIIGVFPIRDRHH